MSCLSEALVELGFGILILRHLPLPDPRTPHLYCISNILLKLEVGLRYLGS